MNYKSSASLTLPKCQAHLYSLLPHRFYHPLAIAMMSPGSETAWHFSSSGTEPHDNQRLDCSSVPSAWLAKVPERMLFSFAECFVSKSLRLNFALQWETSVRYQKCLNPHSLATRFRRFLMEASLLGLLHRSLDDPPRSVE